MAGCAAKDFFPERSVMKLPERWWWCIELQGEYVEKQVLLFEKEKCDYNLKCPVYIWTPLVLSSEYEHVSY
jgi:hypothetical protein